MPRRARLHMPGGVYYVIQRSSARQPIFSDEADYDLFESLLSNMLARCRVRLHAYCWEAHAVHLLVQVADVPLGRFMQRLSSQYARRVQRPSLGSGSLFDRRYQAWLLDPATYLLRLVCQIHLLPVRSGAVAQPGDYRRSSHRDYAGEAHTPWLTRGTIQQMLAQGAGDARPSYHRLIDESRSVPDLMGAGLWSLEDPRILGDPGFLERPAHRPQPPCFDQSLDGLIESIVRTLRVDRAEVLSQSRRRQLALARALITWNATEDGVATLAQVARKLGRDPSTLFVAVQRYRALRPELFEQPPLPARASGTPGPTFAQPAQRVGSRASPTWPPQVPSDSRL